MPAGVRAPSSRNPSLKDAKASRRVARANLPVKARRVRLGGAGAFGWGRRVFAAAAKTAAWHRLPGNRLGPVPLLSRNRLVVDKNHRYVRSCTRELYVEISELGKCVRRVRISPPSPSKGTHIGLYCPRLHEFGKEACSRGADFDVGARWKWARRVASRLYLGYG